MPAAFTQDEINLRELADEFCNIPAQVGKNTQALLPLAAYTGKNILINGDKSVSQRGDFSTPFPVTENRYLLDRFFFQTPSAGASSALHNPFSIEAQAQSILYTVTTASNDDDFHSQLVENFAILAGKTVTYTARIRTNKSINIYLTDGISSTFSVKSKGLGEWETITVTKILDENPIRLKAVISTYDGANYPTNIGDYFEVGNEQLELGSEFTGFEIVDPATQLMKCRRYYRVYSTIHQISDLAYEMRIEPVAGGVAGAYTYDSEM